jgi:hypothetical protein
MVLGRTIPGNVALYRVGIGTREDREDFRGFG